MPVKMKRLANRNALLAKAIDGEIRLIDIPAYDKPSTKKFSALLAALKIDRSCLIALPDVTGPEAASSKNLENCLLYTSPSPRDQRGSRMPSSA